MKKIFVVVIALILLGTLGYKNGLVPYTAPYQKKVEHKNLMTSLKSMNEMSQNLNVNYLRSSMTRIKANELSSKAEKTCKGIKNNLQENSTSEALNDLCDSIASDYSFIAGMSINDTDTVDDGMIGALNEVSVRFTDPAVEQFIRVCEDEKAADYAEKKFDTFSDRFL